MQCMPVHLLTSPLNIGKDLAAIISLGSVFHKDVA